MRKKTVWLCVAPFALCMLDQGITLVGQSSAYWAGDYSVAIEGNPWFQWLLQQHPLAFEAGIFAWVAVFCGLILVLPRRVAMTISVAIVLGHAWGASTWIFWKIPHGYWLVLALYLLSAIAIVAQSVAPADDSSSVMLVVGMLMFIAAGVAICLGGLTVGKLFRPKIPHPEKG
ncbi:MAG: hypothetical protein IIA66_08595, partial [Planctomycetes bacterium]|nr:hypothetical protein [Planctomycetota bacterium]